MKTVICIYIYNPFEPIVIMSSFWQNKMIGFTPLLPSIFVATAPSMSSVCMDSCLIQIYLQMTLKIGEPTFLPFLIWIPKKHGLTSLRRFNLEKCIIFTFCCWKCFTKKSLHFLKHTFGIKQKCSKFKKTRILLNSYMMKMSDNVLLRAHVGNRVESAGAW